MRGGYYRPAYVHALAAGLDAQGNVTGWQHRIVGQSIVAGTAFEAAMIKDGIDATSVEGASTLPYEIPNLRVELHSPKVGVPVLWWRSVGSTHTAYSTETFVDELAAAAGKDPVAFRRALLAKHPRFVAALGPGGGEGRLGQAARAGQGRREARPRRGRARVLRHRRGAGRRGDRQGQGAARRPRRLRGRTAASPSTRTTCARRWKAASASACRRRCTARSPSPTAPSTSRISTITRCCGSTRCRRSRCTSCRRRTSPSGVGEPGVPPRRAGGGQRDRGGHRPATAQAAVRAGLTPAPIAARPGPRPHAHARRLRSRPCAARGAAGHGARVRLAAATSCWSPAARAPRPGRRRLRACRRSRRWRPPASTAPRHYLGALAGNPCVALRVAADTPAPAGWRFAGLRSLFFALPEPNSRSPRAASRSSNGTARIAGAAPAGPRRATRRASARRSARPAASSPIRACRRR